MRMQEAGLLEKWKQEWWPSSDQCSTADRTSDAETLQLDSLSGPFVIYAIVIGLAVAVLILEIFMKSDRMKKYRPKIKFWNFGRPVSMEAKISENGHTRHTSNSWKTLGYCFLRRQTRWWCWISYVRDWNRHSINCSILLENWLHIAYHMLVSWMNEDNDFDTDLCQWNRSCYIGYP